VASFYSHHPLTSILLGVKFKAQRFTHCYIGYCKEHLPSTEFFV